MKPSPTILIVLLALLAAAPAVDAQVFSDERELAITEKFEKIFVARFGDGRMIDASYANDVQTAIAKASEHRNALLILEIDSGGGHTTAAREIVAMIKEHRMSEDLRIVAWVPRQALSAAAWIALASRGLFIAPDALIGDIQPLIGDFRGYERAPEKIVSVLTEELRISCMDNGLDRAYPRLFLEAMVDTNIEIVRVQNKRLGTVEYMRAEDWAAMTENERQGLVGNFIGTPNGALTTNGRDLLEFGFQVKVMKPPVEQLIDMLGTEGSSFEVISFEGAYRESLRWDWHLLFFFLGVVFIILELKSPGISIFGLCGIGAFILFFLFQMDFSDFSIWPIGLFIIGAFLVIVELIFFPGILVALILGFLMMLYSTWIAVAFPGASGLPGLPDLGDPAQSEAAFTWAILLIGSLVGAFVFSISFGKTLHRLPVLNKLVLAPVQRLEAPGRSGSPQKVGGTMGWEQVSEGEEGLTLTPLRPSGVIRVGDRKVDAIARGGVIDAGVAVRIVEVSGNRIVVRALEASS